MKNEIRNTFSRDSGYRVYNMYNTTSEITYDDMVNIISKLSNKYKLKYVTYECLNFNSESDNSDFESYKTYNIAELSNKLKKYLPTSVSAVFLSPDNLDIDNQLCVLFRTHEKNVILIYDYYNERKQENLMDEFESEFRRHL